MTRACSSTVRMRLILPDLADCIPSPRTAGISPVFEDAGPASCGTVCWASPEQLRLLGRTRMSSVQYSLCSTAGLDTVTDTPDGAAAALVRHLSEVGRSRSVDWMITGPGD